MGILANTVSICHFQVRGDLPDQRELFQWVSERLTLHRFRSIDDTADELSTGWVHLDDHRDGSFDVPAVFWRDHYVTFTLRRDQRRIPASLLKAHLQEASSAFLSANPGLRRVPKQKMEEIRETVRLSLLVRTLPAPAAYDAVWDTRTGVVTFTSLSGKTVEIFENLFKKTFDPLRLVPFHPYARAALLCGDELRPRLEKLNQATTEAMLDLIKSNQWLGNDMLLWLMYRCMNGVCNARTTRPGHFAAGEEFVVYLNDRLVLFGGGEGGVQKVTVAGPQDHFSEVLAALHNSKKIAEATIHLEKDELAWRLNLKAETFSFGSFRAPAVTIEKDAGVDPASEREAVFFERMFLLEQGIELFENIFAEFLELRLGDGWGAMETTIRGWLTGETGATDADE